MLKCLLALNILVFESLCVHDFAALRGGGTRPAGIPSWTKWLSLRGVLFWPLQRWETFYFPPHPLTPPTAPHHAHTAWGRGGFPWGAGQFVRLSQYGEYQFLKAHIVLLEKHVMPQNLSQKNPFGSGEETLWMLLLNICPQSFLFVPWSQNALWSLAVTAFNQSFEKTLGLFPRYILSYLRLIFKKASRFTNCS